MKIRDVTNQYNWINLMAKKQTATKGATGQKVAGSKADHSKEEMIAAFLRAGGKIQQIPTGVSGQQNMAGPKHITLGNKPNR